MTSRSSRKLEHDATPPCTVLIVDDDDLVRDQLTVVLQDAGYQVETAGTAQQALQNIERTDCHVVIADWEMPGMDGPALCRTLRGRQRDAYLYVLLFTIRRSTGDVVAGLEAGADDFIVKGAPMAELIARLDSGRRIVSSHAAARQMAPTCHEPAANGEPVQAAGAVAGNSPNFAHALAGEYDACRRRGVPISLLLCVPDNIAHLNERLGARVGSEFLAGMRAEVPKLLLESDWVARCGHEGLVVVLPETGLDGANLVAEKIRSAIAASLQICSDSLPATMSIGVASIDAVNHLHRLTPADLLKTSEQCLARSRRQGGNRTTAALVAPSS